MKRKLICLSVTVFLIIVFSAPVSADYSFTKMPSPFPTPTFSLFYTARWATIDSVILSMSKDYDEYSCNIEAKAGTSKIVSTLTLYEKGWFGYTQVDQVATTTYDTHQLLTGTYNFSKEKSYKLEISSTVTCNGVQESISDYITN